METKELLLEEITIVGGTALDGVITGAVTFDGVITGAVRITLPTLIG